MSEEKEVSVTARLRADVDTKLREHIRRRGELTKVVLFILRNVDLADIPLLSVSSELEKVAVTTLKIPIAIKAALKKVADRRSSSVNALINSAIWAFDESKLNKKK